jgi:peptide/nickel transport system ATP-binding protein
MSAPLLEVMDLKKHFPLRGGFFGGVTGHVFAVDGVSFHIDQSETLALVGESGCGKSTVGKAILKLFDLTSGQVVLDGRRIDDLSPGTLRPMRRRVQVVFQDPFSSLNPRMRVRDILAEPIRNFGLAKSSADLEARVADLMDKVRLPRDAVNRWPHEFSGGQRQRIGIARALAAEPDLIICDEAVSALDVSVKAQIVNLLQDLQNPYTEALLSAVPVPMPGAQRERIILKGDVPSPINPPKGCRFHTRCQYAFDRCRVEEPPLAAVPTALAPGHLAACHLHDRPANDNPLAEAKGEAVLPV